MFTVKVWGLLVYRMGWLFGIWFTVVLVEKERLGEAYDLFDFFEFVFVEVVGGVVFCGVFDDIVLFDELFEGGFGKVSFFVGCLWGCGV